MKCSLLLLALTLFLLPACTRGPVGKLDSLYWYEDYGIPSKADLTDTQYIPNLVRAINDENPRVGIYAVKALKRLGPKAGISLPDLAEAANGRTRDIKVRLHAIEALTLIDKESPTTIDTLAELMLSGEPGKVREAAGQWMTTLGPSAAPAMPSLILALESRYPKVRNYAAMTLGYMGPLALEALPALEKTVALDSRPTVQKSAQDAIRRITYADRTSLEERPAITPEELPTAIPEERPAAAPVVLPVANPQ